MGIISATAAGVLLLAGCGSTEEDTQEANAEACASLLGLQSTVNDVSSAGASAVTDGEPVTVDDVQGGLSEIKSALEDIKDSASELFDAAGKQFEEAHQDYQDAIANIDGDQPIGSAAAEVESAQKALLSEFGQILSEIGC